jgi:hypothetical protein
MNENLLNSAEEQLNHRKRGRPPAIKITKKKNSATNTKNLLSGKKING